MSDPDEEIKPRKLECGCEIVAARPYTTRYGHDKVEPAHVRYCPLHKPEKKKP